MDPDVSDNAGDIYVRTDGDARLSLFHHAGGGKQHGQGPVGSDRDGGMNLSVDVVPAIDHMIPQGADSIASEWAKAFRPFRPFPLQLHPTLGKSQAFVDGVFINEQPVQPRINIDLYISVVIEVTTGSVNAGHERIIDTAFDELELSLYCCLGRGRDPLGTQPNSKKCLVAAKGGRPGIGLWSGWRLPCRTRSLRRNDLRRDLHLLWNVEYDLPLRICNIDNIRKTLSLVNVARKHLHRALVRAAV